MDRRGGRKGGQRGGGEWDRNNDKVRGYRTPSWQQQTASGQDKVGSAQTQHSQHQGPVSAAGQRSGGIVGSLAANAIEPNNKTLAS